MSDLNQQPGYNPNQPYPQQDGGKQWPHMKLTDWLITYLMLLIPIANIVFIFMWALGSNVNPSKKSYFQLMLIMVAIGILLGIVLGGAIVAMLVAMVN